MPKDAAFSKVVLASDGELRLQSHARVEGAGAGTIVTNAGHIGTSLAAHSSLGGDLLSGAQTVLANHTFVDGSLTTTRSVWMHRTATVSGTLIEDAELTPAIDFTVPVEFPPSAIRHEVDPHDELVLVPGAYDSVGVGPNATLTLETGTYTLDTFTVMPGGKLVLNVEHGPVLLFVRSEARWAGVQEVVGPRGRFLLGYLGSSPLDLEEPLSAAVLAPNALLELRKSKSQTDFHGLYWAENVRIGSHVRVVHDPFQYWGLVFPPTPTLKCVTRFTDTHWSALFGYENTLDIEVHVPLGDQNFIEPPGPDRTPIETFAPGVHSSVFFAAFDGTDLTWVLGAQSVTATGCAQRCSLADYPPANPDPPLEVPEGPSDPAPSALTHLVPDQTGPGLSSEPALLPWGIQQPLTRTLKSANPPFKLTVYGENLAGADDGTCGYVEAYVRVSINGGPFERWNFPECPAWPSACGAQGDQHDFFADVPPEQESVPVVIELWEDDSGGCGDDDHVLTADLVVNNGNGEISGGWVGVDVPASEFLGPCGATCHIEHDDFFFDFSVEPSGNPKICAAWNAQYIDAGYGEDLGTDKGVQQFPASFAIATLTLARGGTSTEVRAPLDPDGCFPQSLTPRLGDLGVVAGEGATGLTLKLQLHTQFCLDPNGNGCRDASGDPTGARYAVGQGSGGTVPWGAEVAPLTICTVLTQDENYVDPECEVVTESQGAFAAWNAQVPPSPLAVENTEQTEVTRITAVVSHMLLREWETDNELALPKSGWRGYIAILSDTVCPTVLDTCAWNPVAIQSGDERWKVVTTHEIGHVVQRRSTGRIYTDYRFGLEYDHPGAPPECRCDHIQQPDVNVWHCLQSLEKPGVAQIEGYAQAFASKVWNKLDESDCMLPYYKDFLDAACVPGADPQQQCEPHPTLPLIITRAPVPLSCVDPIRWRNNKCLAPPTLPGEVVADLGVELDWTGFYYKATNPVSPDRLTPKQLHGVYRQACGGVECDEDLHVAWADCVTCSPEVTGIKDAVDQLYAAGHLTLAQRETFLAFGSMYGVSQDTGQ